MALTHGFQAGQVRTPNDALIVITGRVVTTTSGTVGTTDVRGGGVAVAKTGSETGRYTFTVTDAGDTALTDLTFRGLYATIIGPDDTAMTTTKGLVPVIRDIDIGEGADDGTVNLQWVETVTANADTEVQDAAEFTFMLVLGNKQLG